MLGMNTQKCAQTVKGDDPRELQVAEPLKVRAHCKCGWRCQCSSRRKSILADAGAAPVCLRLLKEILTRNQLRNLHLSYILHTNSHCRGVLQREWALSELLFPTEWQPVFNRSWFNTFCLEFKRRGFYESFLPLVDW
jgi:hypothetical protein